MRITNNMIMGNTKTNINSNKINVDKYNTQMTTQKKINKASEDPVIAIRSLRLSTTMTHINQYVDNNIPDADAWMDVTYTALNNMKDLLTDIRTQCVNGATDTLTAEDRQVILKNLKALQDQVYTEGNADYAGRTVFTGYRTTENLTFDKDDNALSYDITENFTFENLEQHRYYYGSTTVPTAATVNAGTNCTDNIGRDSFYRIRLAYDQVDNLNVGSIQFTDADKNVIPGTTAAPTAYDSYEDWVNDPTYGNFQTGDNAVFIRSTGELIVSDSIAEAAMQNKGSLSVSYTRTGFTEGELKPEFYFDCVKNPGQPDEITFTLENQEINYTIANSTQLTINTQARDVFNFNIDRDVTEMIDAVSYAINAEKKVSDIKQMLESEQFADADNQEVLKTYLDAAQKESDLANDNLQKLYEKYIGNFDKYLKSVNTSITNVGSMQARLSLTQNRVENQQTTVEELKSSNEDREMSDIIIDYYAAYNAYTASLTAASKVGQQSLLNFL